MSKVYQVSDEQLKAFLSTVVPVEKLPDIICKTVNECLSVQNTEKQNRADAIRFNTKILLDNYTKFKLFISESLKSLDDVENYEEYLEHAEIMRIFGLREDDKHIRSIEKSVSIMSLLMAHVDRMLDVYKQSCEGSSSVVVQRRYRVIERMYLREKRMTATQIADEFNLELRVIQKDAKMAREDLRVLLFGIDAILSDFAVA